MAFDYLCFFANEANHQADIGIGRFGVNPFRNDDFKAEVWTQIGWDKDIAESYVDTLAKMEESKNRVFPLRVPGTFEFNAALATAAAKALIPIKPTEGSTAPFAANKIPANPATNPARSQVKL